MMPSRFRYSELPVFRACPFPRFLTFPLLNPVFLAMALWNFGSMALSYVIMLAGFGKRDSVDYLHDILRGHILEI